MTEAGLAIVRKVVLCAGLLTSGLLFIYPHWRGSFEVGIKVFEYDLGRGFITAPPIPDHSQLVRLIGMESNDPKADWPLMMLWDIKASYRVHRVRQLTEVALALLLTFGVLPALRKPAGD